MNPKTCSYLKIWEIFIGLETERNLMRGESLRVAEAALPSRTPPGHAIRKYTALAVNVTCRYQHHILPDSCYNKLLNIADRILTSPKRHVFQRGQAGGVWGGPSAFATVRWSPSGFSWFPNHNLPCFKKQKQSLLQSAFIRKVQWSYQSRLHQFSLQPVLLAVLA